MWLAADRGVTGAGFQWAQCDAEQDCLSGSDPLEECLWDLLDRAPLHRRLSLGSYQYGRPDPTLIIEIDNDPPLGGHNSRRAEPPAPPAPLDQPPSPATLRCWQLGSDVPPSPGDRAWEEDTTDW